MRAEPWSHLRRSGVSPPSKFCAQRVTSRRIALKLFVNSRKSWLGTRGNAFWRRSVCEFSGDRGRIPIQIYGRSSKDSKRNWRLAMRGLLVDHNLRGQMERVRIMLESPAWNELWSSLKLRIVTLEEVGLTERAPDDIIGRTCQTNEWCLITGNRNSRAVDSLHQTIERENVPGALPVFTIGDPERVLVSLDYAEKVTTRLIELLSDIDGLRGTG